MPEHLNIAMFSIHSCPMGQLGSKDTGGMNVYVRELAYRLGELGHHVDIYTRAHDPRDLQVEWPFPNVRLIHIRAGAVEDMGKIAQHSHLADFIRNMELFVAEDGTRYDLIHSHYWLSGEVGQHFARVWDIPHITMFHTMGMIKSSLPVGEPEPPVRLEAEKRLVLNCQRIVAATARERDDLVRLYAIPSSKISLIPCGINLERFQPVAKQAARRQLGIDADCRYLLFVGRIEPLKGIDRIIQAVSRLDTHNVRLQIIGGDENSRQEVARLQALAGASGIGEKVVFAGTVPQEKLPLYYSAADVSIMASYYESFCLVVLESLACLTPVVATPVGVAASIIQAGLNGYIAPDNTPENLERALNAVLDNNLKEKMQLRGTAIRSELMSYDWKAIANIMAKEYAMLVREPRPASAACSV